MAMTACCGEIRDQLDLLVGERLHLLPIDGDHADQLALLDHRHHENGARAGRLGERYRPRLAIEIGRFSSEVGDVLHPPGLGNAGKRDPSDQNGELDRGAATPPMPGERRASRLPERRYLRTAEDCQTWPRNARGVLQHRLEHRLQFAR